MSRYTDHKYANDILKNIEKNPEKYFFIHYSCENFSDITDGRTPRVTSIAIKSIKTGQVESFSMHATAEQKHISVDKIIEKYDVIEKAMLKEYFSFIKQNQNMFYLHVNMRDINYGFKAIEHRAKVLGLQPAILHDQQKVDFADLLKKLYGDNYIGHPRMESICRFNSISSMGYMSGSDEASAFEKQEYTKIHQSALAKVEMYTNILNKTINKTLKTEAKWYEVYGVSILGIISFVNSKWWLKLLVWIISAIGSGVIGFYIGKILMR